MATSTTTTLTTRIGSPRLRGYDGKGMHAVHYPVIDKQGAESLRHDDDGNNSGVTEERYDVASCQRTASIDELFSFDNIWDSMMIRRKGVSWKPSVKQFVLNGCKECSRMSDKIISGNWKNGKPHPIKILYPKKRDGLAIRFPDRVYQGILNDDVLYPEMTRHFIYANMACQKGKGPDKARDLLKKYLRNHFHHYGTSGYVLQIDITGYYPNMRHDKVKEYFARYIPSHIMHLISDVLDQQYTGEVGYNPGSQMVQIAGISLLNPTDHMIKERLRIKHYIRYMDDFILIHPSKEHLEYCLDMIKASLADIGLSVSEKKTHITELSSGFRFLGFDWYITETGKIYLTIDPKTVKHEKKKLYRLVQKSVKGDIAKDKADECYKSWKAHAEHGNSYLLLKKMDKYYNELWRTAYESNQAGEGHP